MPGNNLLGVAFVFKPFRVARLPPTIRPRGLKIAVARSGHRYAPGARGEEIREEILRKPVRKPVRKHARKPMRLPVR